VGFIKKQGFMSQHMHVGCGDMNDIRRVVAKKSPWADWYNVNLFIGIVIKKLVCCEGLQNT
jgi:hypothetical protein